MSASEAGIVPPVEHVPAPWKLRAEIYWFFLTLPKLPEGVYDPLEYDTKGTGIADLEKEGKAGEFKGGLGGIMIVRYADTPVGPYDELAFLPGNYLIPNPPSGSTPKSLKIPKKALGISRIYVSQRTTTYNGRLNWNIPKHFARFSFSHPVTPIGASPPKQMTVKVYAPGTKDGDGVDPFFSVTVTPWKWVPAMPVKSKWLPLGTILAQPPVPQAEGFGKKEEVKVDPYDIDPKREAEVLVGTDSWKSFEMSFETKCARGAWVKVHKPGEGVDGKAGGNDAARKEALKHWPADVVPWSVGAWMQETDLGITKSVEWKL